MLNLTTLQNNILHWAEERNLIDGSTPTHQFVKLSEEFGELSSGFAKNNHDVVKDSIGDCAVVAIIMLGQIKSNFSLADLNDEQQDITEDDALRAILYCAEDLGRLAYVLNRSITDGMTPPETYLIELLKDLNATATAFGLDFTTCLTYAWDEIKDRKGRMIDGVFVKEADLPRGAV